MISLISDVKNVYWYLNLEGLSPNNLKLNFQRVIDSKEKKFKDFLGFEYV